MHENTSHSIARVILYVLHALLILIILILQIFLLYLLYATIRTVWVILFNVSEVHRAYWILEVTIMKKEVEQTISVYQSSHSTLSTLLEHRVDEHICMGLSIRLEMVMLIAHFALSMTTMSHVQCATLQHEKLL